jgi:hypothetical protein
MIPRDSSSIHCRLGWPLRSISNGHGNLVSRRITGLLFDRLRLPDSLPQHDPCNIHSQVLGYSQTMSPNDP